MMEHRVFRTPCLKAYHVVNADADKNEGQNLRQRRERNACRGFEQQRERMSRKTLAGHVCTVWVGR